MKQIANRHRFVLWTILLLVAILPILSHAQVTPVGAGGYTRTAPAGIQLPASTVYTTVPGPVPSHKFWTAKYWFPLGTTSGGGDYHINPQPLQASFTAQGLLMGVHSNLDGWPGNDATATAYYQYFNGDLTIGTAGLNASQINVVGSTDWTADFAWGSTMRITLGRGMPYVYIQTDGSAPTVSFTRTPTIVTNNGNVLAVSTQEGDPNFTNIYGLFCPTGGNWTQSGNVFTCNAPAGHNYASVALLPGNAGALNTYAQYAFSFPVNTQASWNYNESTSQVSTTYTVTTQAKEGTETGFLMALYPHQYDALPGGVNTPYTYICSRGEMKVLTGTSFTTVDTFHGILPFLPPTQNYDNTTLSSYVSAVTPIPASTNSYDTGKALNRIAQALPLAKASGNSAAFTAMQTSLQNSMQDWLTATPGKAANLFYYNDTWGSLIGFPASYGSDYNLNDHHFHYGYYVYAAAINGFYSPAWVSSSQWGGMVDVLRQEYGNFDRNNLLFPFARNFDVYAGHSWASGIAGFADGQNQESSSEAVNAWTGMILFGAATNNRDIRDAGIWFYTQELKAAQYYWFNQMTTKTFPSWFAPKAIANLFDAKGDVGTWFGSNPDFTHAIEYLPFTGGSLYLGLDPAYVQINFQEDQQKNIAQGRVGLDWPDMMQMYQALYDPDSAYTAWTTTNALFDGESKAHQYAWLRSLQTLGQVDATVTANTPFYAVFNKSGVKTHVAFNPTNAPLSVVFSDGTVLLVPAGSMISELGTVAIGPGVGPEEIPAAPSNLTAAATSSTAINLSWTASATSSVTYSVFRGTTSGFTPDTPIATGLTATTYSDSGLSPETTYYYVVEAVNGAGSSDPSNEASATTNAGGGTLPGSDKLYLLAGATTSTAGSLSFTAGASAGSDVIPTNNGNYIDNITNPVVYVITGLNGTYDNSKATAFHLYVDSGANVANGVQAQVRYDLDGDGTFDRTEQYSFFATNPVVDWEDYNETARGGLEAGNTSGSLGNMTNGTVEVRIWSALGAASNSVSVSSPTAATQSAIVIPFTSVTQTILPPAEPTGVTATAASGVAINLSWTASTTAGVTYDVYRGTTSGFTPAADNQIATGLTSTSYSDTGLTPSTTYYYVVAAVNTAGSAVSDEAGATTLAGGEQAVGNTLYVLGGATLATPGALSFTAGDAAAVDSVPSNNGNAIDNITNPFTYVVKHITGTYDSNAVTQFEMFVDSGANVANGTQLQIAYDLNGDGTFDRTEQYSFFATDAAAGWEQYDQTSRGGLETGNTTGSLGNMANGTVVLRIWSALGSIPTDLRTNATSSDGNQSLIVLPFKNLTITQLPAAPTGVTATAVSYGQVDLTWTASTTPGSTYDVYRNTTSEFTPATENRIASGIAGTSYSDTTVSGATTYYYIVAAVNGAGPAFSDEASATTQAEPVATTTVVSSSAASAAFGTSVTLTATVSNAAATGKINFKDGETVLQSGVTVAAGVATYTSSTLTVGTHSITAAYSGDSVYSPSTSEAFTQTITAADFAVSAETATATVTAGQSATYALSVTPTGSFDSAVSFTCSGLPSLAACSFSPATVTPGGSAASTTLTITTQAPRTISSVSPSQNNSGSLPMYAMLSPIGLAALIVLGGKSRRARIRRLILSASALLILSMMVACGGGGHSNPPHTEPGTPAGTSTVTITATGGGATHTTTVTLTVQ